MGLDWGQGWGGDLWKSNSIQVKEEEKKILVVGGFLKWVCLLYKWQEMDLGLVEGGVGVAILKYMSDGERKWVWIGRMGRGSEIGMYHGV